MHGPAFHCQDAERLEFALSIQQARATRLEIATVEVHWLNCVDEDNIPGMTARCAVAHRALRHSLVADPGSPYEHPAATDIPSRTTGRKVRQCSRPPRFVGASVELSEKLSNVAHV